MQFSLNYTRGLVPRLHRFTSKIAVDVEPAVIFGLEQATLKPRKHPGVLRPNHVELPKQLSDTLKRIVGDHPIKKLIHDGQQLNAYIKSRHPPPTQEEVENKKRIIIEEVNSKMPLDRLATLDEEEAERWKRKREQEINKRLGQRVYAWKRIEYGPYESIVYAIARGAQEYAVMKRILGLQRVQFLFVVLQLHLQSFLELCISRIPVQGLLNLGHVPLLAPDFISYSYGFHVEGFR